MTRTTTARIAPAPAPAAPRPADPGQDAGPDVRPAAAPGTPATPTLAGEVRGTALLFALALTVTVGAAAVARAFPGLAP